VSMLSRLTTLLSALGAILVVIPGVHTQDRLQDGQSNSTSHYEVAGPYRVVRGLSSQEKSEIESRIRGFLWDHFEGKVAGKLDATFYTLEGEPTQYLFVVDADPTGEWGIRATTSMWRSDLAHPKKKPTKSVVEEKYCYVGRIDPTRNKMIPREEKRNAESYRLVLKLCGEREVTF